MAGHTVCLIALITVVGVPRAATGGQPSGSVHIDRAQLASLVTELRGDERRDLNGVLVSIDGVTALEEYFNGEDHDTLHDIRSAGKSMTSLLVGIAIDRGLIRGVDAPLTTVLPEPPAPDKARIRLEDLLTMRSGLEADDAIAESAGNENKMDRAPDWLTFALRIPMKDTPGETYVYASVNASGGRCRRAGPLAVRWTCSRRGSCSSRWASRRRSGVEVRTIGRPGRAIFGCDCAT